MYPDLLIETDDNQVYAVAGDCMSGVGLIGAGRSALVYRGQALTEGNAAPDVAIKVFHQSVDLSEQEREFKIAQLFLNARQGVIVSTDEASSPWAVKATPKVLVMDYVPGETLDAIVDNETYVLLSGEDKLDLVLAVMYALKAVHDQGVVHRDLRLENIIVKYDEALGFTARVVDFGHAMFSVEASQFFDNTHEGILHAAPELWDASCASSYATDIFSLLPVILAIFGGDPLKTRNEKEAEFSYLQLGVDLTIELPEPRDELKVCLGEIFYRFDQMQSQNPSERPSLDDLIMLFEAYRALLRSESLSIMAGCAEDAEFVWESEKGPGVMVTHAESFIGPRFFKPLTRPMTADVQHSSGLPLLYGEQSHSTCFFDAAAQKETVTAEGCLPVVTVN